MPAGRLMERAERKHPGGGAKRTDFLPRGGAGKHKPMKKLICRLTPQRFFILALPLAFTVAVVILVVSSRSFLNQKACGCPSALANPTGEFDPREIPARFRISATVLVGVAPFSSQYATRSGFISDLDGFVLGSYVPSTSMKRPLLGERESVATIR